MPFPTRAANAASNRATRSRNAAPHRKNALQRTRSDSPYQQRTTQRDNPTQLLIKQAVDYLIQQLEAGKSETLTAFQASLSLCFSSVHFGLSFDPTFVSSAKQSWRYCWPSWSYCFWRSATFASWLRHPVNARARASPSATRVAVRCIWFLLQNDCGIVWFSYAGSNISCVK